MRVLAFDPGYDRLGAAVLEKKNGNETLIYSTCLTSSKSKELPDRLHEIGIAIDALLHEYAPDAIALETLFFSKNAKTVIGVAEVRGICLFLGKQHGCAVYEFSPLQIKVATTGYGKSDKAAMIAMVKRLIKNAPTDAHDDEYDAIAVGLTTLAVHGSK
jgi:crossover junction endodeoxyribonuclease RuvC